MLAPLIRLPGQLARLTTSSTRTMRTLLLAASLLSCCPLLAVLTAADAASLAKAKEELAVLADGASRLSRAFNLVHEVVAPSVVAIHTKLEAPIGRRTLFGTVPMGTREVEVGEGSGFVIRSDRESSYILTNSHVVLRMDENREFARNRKGEFVPYDRVVIETNDNRMITAEYVGWYVEADLAVLKIPTVMPAIEWSDSDQAHVGDWVVALGYPLGVGYSATAGIVSATDRSTGIYKAVGGFESFIQTDAAINRGNSGGPLVDIRGRIVGVNASILSPTGTNLGLGFAIPSNVAKLVSDDLITHKRVRRPVIGVAIGDLSAEDTDKLGLPPVPAVQIRDVTADSPAAKAGLAAGDVVTGINGVPVMNENQFRSRLLLSRIGAPVHLQIHREGKNIEADVVPIEMQDLQKIQLAGRPSLELEELGMTLSEDNHGVFLLAVDPDGAAAQIGLEPNDRLLGVKVSRDKALRLRTLSDAKQLKDRQVLDLLVSRDGEETVVRMRISQ